MEERRGWFDEPDGGAAATTWPRQFGREWAAAQALASAVERFEMRRAWMMTLYGIAVFPHPGPPPVDRAHVRRAVRNELIPDTIGHPPNPVGPARYLTGPPSPHWT